MRWRFWNNGTTMGLRILWRNLCVFIMPLIRCACVRCLNHNPNATISHPIHQQSAHPPVKKTSKCQLSSDLRICSSRLWQQTADRSRRACEWASPGWCMQKFFGCVNRGWCRLAWWHMVYSCEASWMYCQILWNAFGDGALMDIPAACQQHAPS